MNAFEKALLDMKRKMFPMMLYWRVQRAVKAALRTMLAPTEFVRDVTKAAAAKRQKQVFGSEA